MPIHAASRSSFFLLPALAGPRTRGPSGDLRPQRALNLTPGIIARHCAPKSRSGNAVQFDKTLPPIGGGSQGERQEAASCLGIYEERNAAPFPTGPAGGTQPAGRSHGIWRKGSQGLFHKGSAIRRLPSAVSLRIYEKWNVASFPTGLAGDRQRAAGRRYCERLVRSESWSSAVSEDESLLAPRKRPGPRSLVHGEQSKSERRNRT
jgi:hypothetical protein